LDVSRFADLTGRARIRDAALALFAEHGVERTTLREIARSAGLSAGLVRHHFGSKDGLRACCDEYALERLMAVKEAGVHGGRLADPGFLFDRQSELLVLHRYLARSVVDGSSAAQAVLERMIVLGEQWIAEHHSGETGDERAVACVLAAAQIGLLMVHEQISRALGVDVFSPQGHPRLAHALIDFYSTPLLSPDQAADAHAALDQLQQQTTLPPQATSTAEPARVDQGDAGRAVAGSQPTASARRRAPQKRRPENAADAKRDPRA
jgi:TetR/AcrR family transcriptional regulator, regulator of cefoperazone and chloramphenicol sensitivity